MVYDERDRVRGQESAQPSAEATHWRVRRDLERAENNAHLRDHLTETEQIRLASRQHLIVLWKPALAVVVAAALLVGSVIEGGDLGSTQDVLVWLTLGTLLWFAWRWLWWSRNLFVATDRRILKVYGVLSTTVDSMRNQKVTDMRYRRDPLGEILGYGRITIESAGQDQALHDITYLPFPRENYQELCHVIFGEAPRSGGRKKNRIRRRLERIAHRRGGEAGTAYPMDYPDHGDIAGAEREVVEREPHRTLYSSRAERDTDSFPAYEPGYFDDRGGGDGLSDPTRP